VSCGALGNLSDAMTLMTDVPKLVKMKNNQLEEFCSYRVMLRHTYLAFIDMCIYSRNIVELKYRLMEYFWGTGIKGAMPLPSGDCWWV